MLAAQARRRMYVFIHGHFQTVRRLTMGNIDTNKSSLQVCNQ